MNAPRPRPATVNAGRRRTTEDPVQPAAGPHWSALAVRLRWPLPAFVAWAAAWGLYHAGLAIELTPGRAALMACLLGAALSLLEAAAWRRLMMAAGFPLSWWLQQVMHGAPATAAAGTGLPAWAWLLPLAVLGLAYPLRTWRDAPFFPTPREALNGLPEVLPLPPGASILDAGCGLGHGLRALRQAYPQASLHGIEWSWPLWLATWLRCPWARVRRGDMWQPSWREHQLVYLFQRPESMPRAVDKALREMRPGSCLVSLEFKAPGLRLRAVLQREDARPLWVYEIPGTSRRDTSGHGA